jgi:hypothetical protein
MIIVGFLEHDCCRRRDNGGYSTYRSWTGSGEGHNVAWVEFGAILPSLQSQNRQQ